MYPSEIRAMDANNREKAYFEAVKDSKNGFQDSLSTRISAGVGLTQSEKDSLFTVVSKGCHEGTKLEIRRSINSVPNIRNYGIFSRVLFVDGGCMYCAGQSYPDETRTVRKCLL